MSEPRDPVQEILLERNRVQLLDLLRREPEGLGLHLDGGGTELGIDVGLRSVQLVETEPEHPDGGSDGQPTETQPRAHDPTQHLVLRSPLLWNFGRCAV